MTIFSLVGQLKEHTQLAVRCEARKDSGGVVIVKQLAAELQIQFVTELADPFSLMCSDCMERYLSLSNPIFMFFVSPAMISLLYNHVAVAASTVSSIA
ncbi:MAG: hypothetical protein ACLVAV_07890 [Clostridium sp.]